MYEKDCCDQRETKESTTLQDREAACHCRSTRSTRPTWDVMVKFFTYLSQTIVRLLLLRSHY